MRITALSCLSIVVGTCADPPALGEHAAAATVGDYETSSCSNAVVLELLGVAGHGHPHALDGELADRAGATGVAGHEAAAVHMADAWARSRAIISSC